MEFEADVMETSELNSKELVGLNITAKDGATTSYASMVAKSDSKDGPSRSREDPIEARTNMGSLGSRANTIDIGSSKTKRGATGSQFSALATMEEDVVLAPNGEVE
ncbi:hypothetical protein V6N12_046071 [Hibiscus sabdariffa]|uniref:Uncharacterized protein n=1 Tax=Hibiscus sabdariffa TaxID=183260 RepID=A0ABR2G4L3_9ROSI